MKHILSLQDNIEKIKTLYNLAYELRRVKDSVGILYALQGLKLSKDLQYGIGEVEALNLLGKMARYQNHMKDAERYLKEALDRAEKEKYNHGIARAYNELGIFFEGQKKNVYAIDAYLSSGKLFEKQRNFKAAIKPTYNLADLYKDMEVYPEALKHYLKSFELAEKAKDSLGLGRIYFKIAELDKKRRNYIDMQKNALRAKSIFENLERSKDVYRSKILLGQSYDYLQQDEKAIKTYLMTLQKAPEYGIKDVSDLYHNLATVYKKNAQYDSAFFYYYKAQKSFKKANDYSRLAVNYNNLGNLYVSKGNQDKALENFSKSLVLQHQLKDSSLLQKTYQSMSNYFRNIGEYHKALSYRDSSEFVKASINRKIKKTDRFELHYLNDKRKMEAAKNAIEIERNIAERKAVTSMARLQVLFIAMITIVILFFVILRNKKLKHAKEIAELAYEQQKIEAILEREQQEKKLEEMLQEQERKAINTMVSGQEEERARIAKDLHDRLGSMLSVVKIHYKSVEDDLEKIKNETKTQYEKANQLLDEACETVRKIAHNMVSGTLTKFGLLPALKELKKKIEETKILNIELLAHGLDNRLDNSTEIHLYRIVQELLNNIIKHAKATEVTIQILKREKDLNIMVTDNGVGFDPQKNQFEGMGLKSIKARVGEMKGYYLVDSSKGNGTTTTIEIPT
ncbi:hypothetical protein KAOT1_20887 [Kordia algicida OT-1]|uniref:Oxygen sensor histidine kinase NreB n=2 Tax=Kordia TaxID=221065 RepID=A9DM98_9FLAO|nr:hypothetical protein KAOT1_20887 [Kordia algicida OT-1]